MEQDIAKTLDRISMGPSCLDMGWEWEIEPVVRYADMIPRNRKHEGIIPLHGHNIRCSFQRPDTATGAIGRGFGRWWFVEADASESAIIKTAWLAMRQIVDHEMYEAFRVDGVRVFDPHVDVDDLVEINRGRRP